MIGQSTIPRRLRSAAARGGLAGAGLVFGYAAIFLVYAVLRSSLTLFQSLDGGNLALTLVAYSASLALPALVFACLIAPFAALVGGGTGLLMSWLSARLNPAGVPARAIWIGSGAALGLALAGLLALRLGLGLSAVRLTWPTYLFWLGVPGAIYIIAGGAGGWLLNKRRASGQASPA